jgi:nitrate/nitrite transport system ATP-binding protein
LAFIEVRDLSKSFPGPGGVRHVLRNVRLDVERGSFVSVVGAMGSGKSTLLSLVAGLTTADTGMVTIDGELVRGVRQDAAMVFQNYSLLPWLTALENVRVAVGAAFPDLNTAEQRATARRALEAVGLGNALSRRPRQLSGGMRQRVAIARAFATRPQLLFLDEPFGALDALTRDTLQQELARLCDDATGRVTTLMITNNVEEAILLSDWIVPMIPGPPATLGTPIAVQLPRPRTVAQLAHDEAATQVRAHVIGALTAAMPPGRTIAGASRTARSVSHERVPLAPDGGITVAEESR